MADTNLIAYVLINSAQTAMAEAVLEKDGDWHAPPLWRHEFRNILATYVRANRLALPVALRHMSNAEALIVTDESSELADTAEILRLAKSAAAPSYDCEFVVASPDDSAHHLSAATSA
ncbi:MAG: type II toxin-antitoxin system VapC family toxin [Betaproteobacteria bacterium]|uniref:Type II toxin-antitoxin system VapC family toxin n=1 Tax=Candidatus Proximibacter danicus TaxID=2954365 RepID=A0A9D7K3J8_9PROT|nr:type II toxin-antitoxin system VapC family toxin [Candidatus Proximibacter danicus]